MFAQALVTLLACVACSSYARRAKTQLHQQGLVDDKDSKSLDLFLLALQTKVLQRRPSSIQSNRIPLEALRGPRVHSPVTMETKTLIDTPKWTEIKNQLDALPVFTVANEDKKPLQYVVNGQPMVLFYADVKAAKIAWEHSMKQFPDSSNDLIQVGLGTAYALSREGKASIVPGVAELTFLGMPEGMSAIGQELPLLGCMNIDLPTEDGGTITPLYMSIEDSHIAMKDAKEGADSDDKELEIVGLTLQSVIDHLSQNEGQAFTFIAPTSSIEHISTYIGKGVYYRTVEE